MPGFPVLKKDHEDSMDLAEVTIEMQEGKANPNFAEIFLRTRQGIADVIQSKCENGRLTVRAPISRNKLVTLLRAMNFCVLEDAA